MNLPEVQIKKVLDGILLAIRADTLNSATADSFLYRILYGNASEKWDYYTQGKDIFNRKQDHPRILETRIFFDRTRASLPTIHITLPNLQSGNDGIGMDEGYQPNYESTIPAENDGEFNTYLSIPTYTRAFQTTYHLIITSDNAFEVLTIYHVVKAALIGNVESLEYYGLRNVKFSGQDLQIDASIVPPAIFSRGIGLNLMYEADVPAFRLNTNVGDLNISGKPI